MPRYLPRIEPRDIPVMPERLVYEALAALSDEYVVMHSLPWLRPDRDLAGRPLREGEADFVIVHPRRGLLVIEVKGGDLTLEDRKWTRRAAGGQKEIRDPFEQARRNLHALLDAVEASARPPVRRAEWTYGYGVIFPTHRYDGQLPPGADPRVVVDARSMADLPRRIEGMYQSFGAARPAITGEQLRAALAVLAPRLQLTRCVGADIALDEARLIQLTEVQQATMLGLLQNPRILIHGVAGSGKTLLALEAAVAHAEAGRRALYLCFNKHLARWASERVDAEPRLKSAPGEVQVSHFHALAGRLIREAGVQLTMREGDPSYWDTDVPAAAMQAIDLLRDDGREPGFDAIIVDEGQDFSTDWWDVVRDLLVDPDAAPLQVFFDRDQALRAEAAPPTAWLPARLNLDTNCRNTEAIALSGAALTGARVRVLPGTPAGEAPRLVRLQASADQAGLVAEELGALLRDEGLRPSQIALIGPARWQNGALSRLEVDKMGLDSADRRYLRYIAEHYSGGPVGIETIAAGLSEQRDALEETIEPYLLQCGLLARTPRGRVLTDGAFRHLGMKAPKRQPMQEELLLGEEGD